MNDAKIQALKDALNKAYDAHEAEKARLIAAGLKSQQRYEALKPLKAVVDAANTAYWSFTSGQIKEELNAIIKANPAPKRGTPERAEYNARRAIFMYTK